MSDMQESLSELEQRSDFIRRHIGPDEEQLREMLSLCAVASLDALIDRAVPDSIRAEMPALPMESMNERQTIGYLRRMRERNRIFVSMIGMGYYGTVMPAVIKRNVLENPGWYTAYTPYQAEVSQGRLEALLNFQQMVMDLTGMEIANASLLDESTAAAEAMAMSKRVSKGPGKVFFVDRDCHPQTIAVLLTRAEPLGLEVVIGDPEQDFDRCDAFGVLVQYPGSSGAIRDIRPIAEAAHAKGALLIAVFTEAVSLGLVESPGAQGADIVVGEGQSIGNALSFGGPYVGLFATRQKFVRQMPGRLCGETVDAEGRRGFVLTLSTREQHIRRDKATSNICTNSGLCCLAFTIHMTLLGETGLTRLAALNHANAVRLAESLSAVPGVSVLNDSFFNEFTIRVPGDAAAVIEKLARKGVLGGVPVSRLDPGHPGLADLIVVASTEINTDADRAAYAKALKEVL
jgi:glycine dehydrogenase subunit 1